MEMDMQEPGEMGSSLRDEYNLALANRKLKEITGSNVIVNCIIISWLRITPSC